MSNHDPYSDSPGSWLVGTTKVYSGVGADIVMESITLIDPFPSVASGPESRNRGTRRVHGSLKLGLVP
jgi:hypothetical protein